MSFMKKMPAQRVNSDFSIEVVADPSKNFSEEQQVAQKEMIQKIHRVSNGLFLPNPAVNVNGAIKSGQTYSKSVKMPFLIDAMRKHGLVMRVSVSGEHTACAMATPDHLENNSMVTSPSGSFSLGIRDGYIRDIDFA